jgi:uracil phosphoribosyltransferase
MEKKDYSEFGRQLHVVDHPLVAHKLSILRDKNTSVKDFRELVSEIGMLITYEATRDLELTTKIVETPICTAEVPTLAGKKLAVVPILRAGLGLVDGVLRMDPAARVGHIGMYRDEKTLEPHVYFCKLPKDIADREVMIVDPMLATGGSADEAITELKSRGCKSIKLMVLLAAPEGIRRIIKSHPDVDIYCGAVDDHLNENGYIVPGLGDAGDRIFGTK